MLNFKVTVSNPNGIHVRPAAELVKISKANSCRIVLSKKGKRAEADELMKILGLDICCGDEITVEISGENETAVAEKVRELISERV